MNNANKFLIGAVSTLLVITILFSQEETHKHQIVECIGPGYKIHSLTFCHTDSAQVTMNGNHLYNLRSERFFNEGLENCQKRANW